MIVGGRAHVRRSLYMATIAAIKYNPVIRAFFHRLVTAGRLAKSWSSPPCASSSRS